MSLNPAACFFVICKADDDEDGVYVLATRETFPTRIAANVYAATVSPSREPIIVEAPRGMTREAEAAAVLRRISSTQGMANALAVFILDSKLYNWLKANDPKALEQAINAVNGYDPGLIEGKIPQAPSKVAYVLVPGNQPGKRIAKAKYNESGYFTTDAFDPGSEDEAREIVNRLNAEIGVTPEVSDAFLAGSMFGWHVPASNPAHAYLGQPLRVPGAAVKPDPEPITEEATCPECGSHNIRVRVDAYAFYDLAGYDADGEAVAKDWNEPDDVSTFDDRDYVCADCEHESHNADEFIGDPVAK